MSINRNMSNIATTSGGISVANISSTGNISVSSTNTTFTGNVAVTGSLTATSGLLSTGKAIAMSIVFGG
jgi:hypothetical protein